MLGDRFQSRHLTCALGLLILLAIAAAPYRVVTGRVLHARGRIGKRAAPTAFVRLRSLSGAAQGMRVVALWGSSTRQVRRTRHFAALRRPPTASPAPSLPLPSDRDIPPALTHLRC